MVSDDEGPFERTMTPVEALERLYQRQKSEEERVERLTEKLFGLLEDALLDTLPDSPAHKRISKTLWQRRGYCCACGHCHFEGDARCVCLDCRTKPPVPAA